MGRMVIRILRILRIQKTHRPQKPIALIGVIREIRQASLDAEFSNKLNTTSHMRVRDAKSEEFFLGQAVFFLALNRKAKGDTKWLGPVIIIGRFGCEYALVHFRVSYLEAVIDDMLSPNRLSLWIIGRDGTLQLHVS